MILIKIYFVTKESFIFKNLVSYMRIHGSWVMLVILVVGG